MSEIRLTIAVPTAGMVCAGFMKSGMGLIGYLGSRGIASRPKDTLHVSTSWAESASWIGNRHALVKGAIETGQTHILFLDDDMVFEPNIADVLFSRRHPVVVTNYLIKCDKPEFVAVGLDGKRLPTTKESSGIEPILYSGFGVSLFDVEVFKKTPRPWFTPDFSAETDEYTTEDNPCYRKIREAGFPVYLDHDATKLVTSHVGRKGWCWSEWVAPAPVPNPVACATNGRVLPKEFARG